MIPKDLKGRLRILSLLILLSGICGAGLAYRAALAAPAEADNPLLMQEYSKRYARDLEVMGGTSAILAKDISNWFASLWQGKRLAYSILWISLGLSFAVYRVADWFEPYDGPPD